MMTTLYKQGSYGLCALVLRAHLSPIRFTYFHPTSICPAFSVRFTSLSQIHPTYRISIRHSRGLGTGP